VLDSETKRKIDTLRDILVGKIPNPQSQVEQITTGLIYKFMNDMDEESVELGGDASFFVDDYKKYAWNNLFDSQLGGIDKVNLYSEAIENMYFNPSAPKLFRDIFKNAFLPFKDPSTLNMFLKEINEFHYSHSEKLGDAFEYLISIMGSQGDAGQFRTPRHIIDFIVEIVNPKKDETILDPGCGTAGFLISSYKHILKSNTTTKSGDQLSAEDKKIVGENLSGYDISPEMIRLSLVNMYLHGFKTPKVDEYDTLSSEDKWNEYFDVILANPPFFSPKGGIQPHKRFGVDSKKAEVLFTSYILEHLKPNGRAGIIVPEGVIFQTGKAYKELRKQLIETALIGVISLPAGVFNPYSAVKTSILILDKKLSKERDSIFFAKVENDGFSLGAQRTPTKDNDLNLIKEKISLFSDSENSNYFKIISVNEILNSKDFPLSSNKFDKDEQIISSFELVNIKNYASFERGTSKSAKEFMDGTVPVVAGGKKPSTYCNESNRAGNIITISSSGANAGFVNFYKTEIFASDCFTIRSKSGSLRQNFLYFLLKNHQDKIFKMQTGGAQPHVYSRDFDNFQIPLPPLEVQEEIVGELEGYQKIIDGCKQVVENYKPIIDIDPSWEMVELGEICSLMTGGTPKSTNKDFYEDGEIPWIVSGDIHKEEIYDCKGRITQQGFESSNTKFLPVNSVLIALNGQGKTRGTVAILRTKATCNQSIVSIMPNEANKLKSEYLYVCLKSLYQQIRNLTGDNERSGLNMPIIRTIKIPLAPIKTQIEIVQKIEEERQVIEGNKKLIEIYTQKIQNRINKVWGE
jgi:type I restriction enzyme M protein